MCLEGKLRFGDSDDLCGQIEEPQRQIHRNQRRDEKRDNHQHISCFSDYIAFVLL
jgi:hypothetical protein